MTLAELQSLLSDAEALEPTGAYGAALDALATVVQRAADEGHRSIAATALYHKAKLLRLSGEPSAALESAHEAERMFREVEDPVGQAQALLVRGEILSDLARIRDFEQACEQALQLARRGQNPLVEARALTLLGTARIYQGDIGTARGDIEAAVAIYQQAGDRRGWVASLLLLARADRMQGRLQLAAESMELAVKMLNDLGDRRAMAAACINLGVIDMERGELASAKRTTEQGLNLVAETAEVPVRLRGLLLRSQIEVEAGEWDTARQMLQDALLLSLRHDQKAALPEIYRVMAQEHLGRNDIQEAERYAQLAGAAVEEDDPYSEGTTGLVTAIVLGRQGRHGQANAQFSRAIERLEESGEAFEIGWGHIAYADYLLTAGRGAEARQHLGQAQSAFSSIEAFPRVERLDELLRTID